MTAALADLGAELVATAHSVNATARFARNGAYPTSRFGYMAPGVTGPDSVGLPQPTPLWAYTTMV